MTRDRNKNDLFEHCKHAEQQVLFAGTFTTPSTTKFSTRIATERKCKKETRTSPCFRVSAVLQLADCVLVVTRSWVVS